MLARQYAKALYKITLHEPADRVEQLFSNFVGLLKKKGHLPLLPQIGKELEILLQKNRSRIPLMTVFSKVDQTAIKDGEKIFVKYFDGNDVLIKEDKNIIGGFSIKSDTKIYDASHKKMLVDLYQKMIF